MPSPQPRIAGGRYRLEEAIGSGGMGTVHRAYDESLHRAVAVKTMRWEGLAPDARERASARLLREARAMAKLHHPNVVSIFDVCVEGDATFVIMELVDGCSLRERVKRPAAIDERIGWLFDVARALAYAHENALCHRDIKPENVLITNEGVAKVADFGTARTIDAASTLGSPATSAPITAEGKAVGTVQYMAPEQLTAKIIDPSSDQFAWGVLGYELLAGAHPWSTIPGNPPALEVLSSRMRPAPLVSLAKDAPRPLIDAIERAMSFEPGNRFPSIQSILDACAAKPTPLSSPPNAPDFAETASVPPVPRGPATKKVEAVEPVATTRRSQSLDDAPAPSPARQRRSSSPHSYQSHAPPQPAPQQPMVSIAPRARSGVSTSVIILAVIAGVMLGACGLCVGLGALGYAGSASRQVSVQCGFDPAGYNCLVANTAGPATANVCWDLRVTCTDGNQVSGRACQSVNLGGKATRKVQATELDGKCSPTSVKVEHLRVN